MILIPSKTEHRHISYIFQCNLNEDTLLINTMLLIMFRVAANHCCREKSLEGGTGQGHSSRDSCDVQSMQHAGSDCTLKVIVVHAKEDQNDRSIYFWS